MQLYERFISGEIDEDLFKREKTKMDTEISRLRQKHCYVSSNVLTLRNSVDGKTNLQDIAKDIVAENTMYRDLADALIEKIYVHPDRRLSITWKIDGFSYTPDKKIFMAWLNNHSCSTMSE